MEGLFAFVDATIKTTNVDAGRSGFCGLFLIYGV